MPKTYSNSRSAKWEEERELAKIVDTYNDCIDKLEQMGYVVGQEYDGRMDIGFDLETRQFYIMVAY